MPDRLVLFADNDDDFRVTRAAFIERAGYRVIHACSVADATEILATRWVHVAVLDLKLRNDKEAEDISGLLLAKEDAFRHIPKIILTSFPSFEYVRDVMTPSASGLPSAVNFISKLEDPQVFIAAVHDAFADHLKINWDLIIRWGEGCPWTFTNLAALLIPGKSVVDLVDLGGELEDLMRSLFPKGQQVTCDRLLWRTSQRLALSVIVYGSDIPERNVIVTCSTIEQSTRERQSIEKLGLSAPVVGIAHLVCRANTLHFGANCYELNGTNLETIKSFGQFFAQAPPREVNNVLDRLMTAGLGLWHRNAQLVKTNHHLEAFSRTRVFDVTFDVIGYELIAKIAAIGQESAKAGMATFEINEEWLTVQVAKGKRFTYPCPALWFRDAALAATSEPILYSTTISAISADNILIDSHGQPWITDFGAVSHGPVPADYAALETSIKFNLLDDSVTLEDVNELEELLLNSNNLNKKLNPGSQQLSKVIAAVYRIRQQAASLCGVDIAPYYLGLLSCAAEEVLAYTPGVRRTRRELMPLIHACISMGMISAKLTQMSQEIVAPPKETTGIEFDAANRQFRVDGRPENFPPTEYAALLYLWEHAENLCPRKELFEFVYKDPYQPGKMSNDDSKLNMTLQRIRDKIEVNAKDRRYLISRPNAGYILYPRGIMI